MSGTSAALIRTWPVGRFTVTLTVPRLQPGQLAHAEVTWSPGLPDRLTTKEITAYQRGLAAALADLGQPAPIAT